MAAGERADAFRLEPLGIKAHLLPGKSKLVPNKESRQLVFAMILRGSINGLSSAKVFLFDRLGGFQQPCLFRRQPAISLESLRLAPFLHFPSPELDIDGLDAQFRAELRSRNAGFVRPHDRELLLP